MKGAIEIQLPYGLGLVHHCIASFSETCYLVICSMVVLANLILMLIKCLNITVCLLAFPLGWAEALEQFQSFKIEIFNQF